METSIASSPSIAKQEIVDPSIHYDLELEDHTMEVEKQVDSTDVVTEQKPLQEGDTSTLGSYVGPSTIPTFTHPPYDYTEHFITETVFPSDEALVDWIRCTSKQHVFIIVIKGSEKCIKNRTPRMRFSCEMSGKYRPFVKKVDGKEVAVKKRVRSMSTKKCECPFELKVVKGNDGWTVSVHNDTHQCLTFLPLRYLPLPPESRHLIAFGHVNNDHFVTVNLQPNSPISPIARNWYIHHYSFADGWDTQYSNKIEEFKSIVGNNVATTDIIELY